MEPSVFADLISSSSPQPPLDAGVAGASLTDVYAQVLTVAFACLLMLLIIGWLWPASKPFAQLELLWTVAPREAERARIWRLILPPDALDYGEEAIPRSTAASSGSDRRSPMKASVVQRVTDTVRVARLLSPDPRRRDRQQAWEHSWTFRPATEAARDCTPLLVFINRASGGRQGEATLAQLRSLLSPQQVVDLSQGHAEQALQCFRSVGRFRVLVCGGDGTVGWVLALLDGAGLEYTPPVAILPLGTGNDLARALGWGGSHPGRGFISLLEDVDSAQVALLDRWQVGFTDARVPKSLTESRRGGVAAAAGSGASASRPARSVIMQNYVGVGVDAKVALEWHQRRQSAPQLFTSRLRNKLQYARYGVKHVFRRDFAEMCAQLTVVCDGVPITLPPGTEGIIILNIASYGGGSDLWGSSEQMDSMSELWNADESNNSSPAHAPTPLRQRSHNTSCSADTDHPAFGSVAMGADPGRTTSQAPAGACNASTSSACACAACSGGGGSSSASGGSGGGSGNGSPWQFGTARPHEVLPRIPRSHPTRKPSLHPSSRTGSRDATSSDTSADEWLYDDAEEESHVADSTSSFHSPATPGGGSTTPHSHYGPTRTGTPPMEGFVPASMDDRLLEVVAVEGVLQLGLAQMSLTNARRLCQCSSITITSSSNARLPLQVDGEPFEIEPIFAPRKPMSISISHHNQAVMLSRSRVRSDGVALEAIDWAMQEGVLTVEQRNQVVREIARRTGSLQRRALSQANLAGSNLSLPSLG